MDGEFLAGLCFVLAGCSMNERELQVGTHLERIHDGEQAPIEAFVALPRPTVILRGAQAGTNNSTLVSLALDLGQSAEVSPDGSRFIRTNLMEDGIAPKWRDGGVDLSSGWNLLVRARGELAWTGHEPKEEPTAWWHDPRGSRAFTARARILWADADDDGRRVVLAHPRGTRLLERDAGERDLPAAEGGRISPDGRWLLLDHGEKLTIRALDRPASEASFPTRQPAEEVVYSADSARVAWIALDTARVFELGNEVRLVFERVAPPEQEWRDAAFAPAGGLVLGAIRAVQHGFRDDPRTGTGKIDPSATIRVERFSPDLRGDPEVLELPVVDWNSRSPELVFAGERLLMTVWPSVYEVVP